MEWITITTGKVKPMAERGSVPSLETNHVSARLKAIMARNATAMGGGAIRDA